MCLGFATNACYLDISEILIGGKCKSTFSKPQGGFCVLDIDE